MEPGRDAWELIKKVWMTKGPHMITLPVDPVAIGQDLEIEVLDDDQLSPEVSSVLRKAPGSEAPQILLNPVDGPDRRRFPCGLALGHYSRCIELGIDGPWEFVDCRDFLTPSSLDDGQAYRAQARRSTAWMGTMVIEVVAVVLMVVNYLFPGERRKYA